MSTSKGPGKSGNRKLLIIIAASFALVSFLVLGYQFLDAATAARVYSPVKAGFNHLTSIAVQSGNLKPFNSQKQDSPGGGGGASAAQHPPWSSKKLPDAPADEEDDGVDMTQDGPGDAATSIKQTAPEHLSSLFDLIQPLNEPEFGEGSPAFQSTFTMSLFPQFYPAQHQQQRTAEGKSAPAAKGGTQGGREDVDAMDDTLPQGQEVGGRKLQRRLLIGGNAGV